MKPVSTGCRVNAMRLECQALRQAELHADIAIEIEETVRELRPHVNNESQPWLKNLYASLRAIQRRIDEV